MSPMRILIIAILIYIAFLVLRSGRKKNNRAKKIKPDFTRPHSATDVLVEDPVCKSLVPKGQAVILQYEDSMVYFCSDDCCKKFMEEKNLKS
jgi:YHS domain-containing protein